MLYQNMPDAPRVWNRRGEVCGSLAPLLAPMPVTGFVGGGGKTSSILALARELCRDGARVIVTTTTHIRPVAQPWPKGMTVVGIPVSEGRLGEPEDLAKLARECDYLLIEADGSRGYPVKAPAAHEPALWEGMQMVIAVQGMTAFGRRIAEAAHRPERVSALLGKAQDELLVPEDGAKLLTSIDGQRKCVDDRRYAVVLNQADGARERAAALTIAALLPEDMTCAVTSYRSIPTV